LQKADFDAAIKEFEAALAKAPNDVSLHYNLGLARKMKDDLPGAIEELRKAEQLDPGNADVHYTLGVTLWQQGQFAPSAEELEAAIKSRPEYAEAYYTLGTVLKQQQKLPEAAAALREAVRLQPEFAGAHTTLAAVLRQMGDDDGAHAEAKLGAEIARNRTNLQGATFSTNSGKHLLDTGDVDGAITQLRSAVQQSENYAPAHFYLGQALERKGQNEEANKEFARASELDSRFQKPSK
jgi:tetratricopeptide (TPR) repeat protein